MFPTYDTTTMNYDVDDPEKGIQSDVEREYTRRSLLGRQRNIFSRIRNFNISHIGSAFSGPLSAISSYVTQEGTKNNYRYDIWNYANDLESGRAYESTESPQDASPNAVSAIATQTHSNSPLRTQSKCLPDTNGFFNTFSRFCGASLDQDQITTSNSLSSDSDWKSLDTSYMQANHPPLHATSVYDWGETSGTPPLTPDSFENISLPSSCLPRDYHNDLKSEYDNEQSSTQWTRFSSHSSEIKEGKKPDRVRQPPSFSSS